MKFKKKQILNNLKNFILQRNKKVIKNHLKLKIKQNYIKKIIKIIKIMIKTMEEILNLVSINLYNNKMKNNKQIHLQMIQNKKIPTIFFLTQKK